MEKGWGNPPYGIILYGIRAIWINNYAISFFLPLRVMSSNVSDRVVDATTMVTPAFEKLIIVKHLSTALLDKNNYQSWRAQFAANVW